MRDLTDTEITDVEGGLSYACFAASLADGLLAHYSDGWLGLNGWIVDQACS